MTYQVKPNFVIRIWPVNISKFGTLQRSLGRTVFILNPFGSQINVKFMPNFDAFLRSVLLDIFICGANSCKINKATGQKHIRVLATVKFGNLLILKGSQKWLVTIIVGQQLKQQSFLGFSNWSDYTKIESNCILIELSILFMLFLLELKANSFYDMKSECYLFNGCVIGLFVRQLLAYSGNFLRFRLKRAEGAYRSPVCPPTPLRWKKTILFHNFFLCLYNVYNHQIWREL